MRTGTTAVVVALALSAPVPASAQSADPSPTPPARAYANKPLMISGMFTCGAAAAATIVGAILVPVGFLYKGHNINTGGWTQSYDFTGLGVSMSGGIVGGIGLILGAFGSWMWSTGAVSPRAPRVGIAPGAASLTWSF